MEDGRFLTRIMNDRYLDYLLTNEWKQRRIGCIKQHGGKCAVCGSGKRLHVNHLTYEHIFNEPLEDLMALCGVHHEAIERAVKNDQIIRTGDVAKLRIQTLELLRVTSRTISTQMKGVVQIKLLDDAWFLKALKLKRKRFVFAVKRFCKKFSNAQEILSNALSIYDRRRNQKNW